MKDNNKNGNASNGSGVFLRAAGEAPQSQIEAKSHRVLANYPLRP